MDAWTTTPAQAAERVSAFLWKGLQLDGDRPRLTAVVAFAVAGSPELIRTLVGNRLVFFGLVIAELGLVLLPLGRAASMAPGTAAGLFALYSALNGVTLSVVLLAYNGRVGDDHVRGHRGHVRRALACSARRRSVAWPAPASSS